MAKLTDEQLLLLYRQHDDSLLDFSRALIELCAVMCDKEAEGVKYGADNGVFFTEPSEDALCCAKAVRELNG